MADSATVAAMKRIGSRFACLKLDYGWNSLLDLATVFVGTEDQAWITFLARPVGEQIDFEAVRLIKRRDLQLHLGTQLYADGRRSVLILFGGNFDDLHVLVRLRSIRRAL